MEHMLTALKDLPDVGDSAPHPEDDVVVQFRNGPEFEVLGRATAGNVLTHITTQILPGFISSSHPKLLQRASYLIREKMDEEMFLQKQGDHPLVQYIASLTPEEINSHLRCGITLQYKTRAGEQGKTIFDSA
eukprot:CAMPEP_0170494224 /NCGR_PEP_ID=MMETSP0208-20121228/14517_1 /TAXON_ID=197538 /ORGANISM="Strombidium inclinatum, Strain S3" /LENGTH=131 /DNA_ID=CAMNT_0010770247 /DNA_START=1058 /DNA_END=1449 /DNA_ORIENTATION=-